MDGDAEREVGGAWGRPAQFGRSPGPLLSQRCDPWGPGMWKRRSESLPGTIPLPWWRSDLGTSDVKVTGKNEVNM